jgi:hypothetical protein
MIIPETGASGFLPERKFGEGIEIHDGNWGTVMGGLLPLLTPATLLREEGFC